MFEFNPEKAIWFCEPKAHAVSRDRVEITTDPHTDFWQNTYYGFCHDNAHVLYVPTNEKFFSFTVKIEFDGSTLFDQCGIAIYQDSENWVKTGIEYHDERTGWLGSVVTNHSYSDWATTDIDAAVKTVWYRLSRRDSDYCLEHSLDGVRFKQMRIFHLNEGAEEINLGLMACSPAEGSFKAVFTEMKVTDCLWDLHEE